jgi:hypothetical protein
MGQSLHFDYGPAPSGVPRSTDILVVRRHVSNLHNIGQAGAIPGIAPLVATGLACPFGAAGGSK